MNLPIPPGQLLSTWNLSPTEHFVFSLVGNQVCLTQYSKQGGSWGPACLLQIPESAFVSALQFYLDFRHAS